MISHHEGKRIGEACGRDEVERDWMVKRNENVERRKEGAKRNVKRNDETAEKRKV